MYELYEGIELDGPQTEAICRGLLDLAACDGVDPSELDLIHGFYRSSGASADLDVLAKQGFDLAAAAKVLQAGGGTVVEAFFISCYLLIYADGEFSDPERKRIAEFGDAFGLDANRLEHLHLKARVYLLEMLAQNLRNPDAVRSVGGELLGLSSAVIEESLNKEG